MNPFDQKVSSKVREILASKVLDCPMDEVNDCSISSLDSIGRITLLVELENDFGVELTAEDYDVEIFSSIEKLSSFVASRVTSQK